MPELYTSLLEWRRVETTSRTLGKLPPDFFASTTRYLEELKRSYESELRENPSARKGEIARQTYHRANQVARDILESRLQKVLTLAFQASIGALRDLPNSLTEEKGIFDQVLGAMLEYRHVTAPYLETAPAPPGSRGPPTTATPVAPSAPPPGTQTPPAPAVAASATREYIHIVGETRTIEAGSETIALAPDDVLSVPPELARFLIDAKVAEPLTVTPLRRAP